jgi:hypothetical protein
MDTWTVIGSVAGVLSLVIATYAFVRGKRSKESEQARGIAVSHKCNVFLWEDNSGSQSELLNKIDFTIYNGSSNIIYRPRIIFNPAPKKLEAKQLRISPAKIRQIRRKYNRVFEFHDQIGYDWESDKRLSSFTRQFELESEKHDRKSIDLWTNPVPDQWATLSPGESAELSVITIHSDYHYRLTLCFADAQRREWWRDVKTAYLRTVH